MDSDLVVIDSATGVAADYSVDGQVLRFNNVKGPQALHITYSCTSL